MRVEDILRDKGTNVATISPDASISFAFAMLRYRGIGALVVTTATNPVSGIPSEGDIVLASAKQGPSVLKERSAQI